MTNLMKIEHSRLNLAKVIQDAHIQFVFFPQCRYAISDHTGLVHRKAGLDEK